MTKWRRPKELIDIVAFKVQETEKAVQFNYDGENIWLPKSQIEYHPTPDGKMWEITLPTWLAEEKDINP